MNIPDFDLPTGLPKLPAERRLQAELAAQERARGRKQEREEAMRLTAEYLADVARRTEERIAASHIDHLRRAARLRVAKRAWHGAVPEDVIQALLKSMD